MLLWLLSFVSERAAVERVRRRRLRAAYAVYKSFSSRSA